MDNSQLPKNPGQKGNKKNTSSKRQEKSKTSSNIIKTPSIELPKGGGAIKAIDEKLSINPINGTSSFSIPVPVTKTESLYPELSLGYDSGNGNGLFGLGWSINIPSIKRKTNNELPQYTNAEEPDTFVFSGVEDLVPEFKKDSQGLFLKDAGGDYILKQEISVDNQYAIQHYKPRIEGLYSRIEKWTNLNSGQIKWRVISKDNTTTLFGWSKQSVIVDPENENKTYEWLPELVFDSKGNCIYYKYKKEDKTGLDLSLVYNKNRFKNGEINYTNLYPEKILYGNKTPYSKITDAIPQESDFLFQLVFDYGEYDTNSPYNKIKDWEFRKDPFSYYKPGFEIRTTRLCKRILQYHFFDDLPGGSALVKSLNLQYDSPDEDNFTFLKSYSVYGYIKKADGSYTFKKYPDSEFTYQEHKWDTKVQELGSENIKNLPVGIDEQSYTFTDLFNEGISGILSEQSGEWYYKENLGNGNFTKAKIIAEKPSFKELGKKLQLTDLESDGSKQLVNYKNDPKGYFDFDDHENKWTKFFGFEKLPNIDLTEPDVHFIDLNGNGKADILLTDENVFTWHQSEGKKGFGEQQSVYLSLNEENSPYVVFSDEEKTIFLADMTGDGLTDIVKIKNGEASYWPNLGYGKFGSKINMGNAPVFDYPDQFNPQYIKLADIDGSGTTDIIYLGKNKFSCWINKSGNSFGKTPFEIDSFPAIHPQAKIDVADLLGTGMSCIVWSGALSKETASLKYIDLTGSRKPYIMVAFKNNLGKEINLTYKPSTQYYLQDKLNGDHWVTKLHFPVHCVSQIETKDTLSGSSIKSQYKYRHGYYDHAEREFRGFGMVEQTDTETYQHLVKNDLGKVEEKTLSSVPTVAKMWHHTGAFISREKILGQYAEEYWYKKLQKKGYPVSQNEAVLDDAELIISEAIGINHNMPVQEWREALRACKGMEMRVEVFGKDAPEQNPSDEQIKKELTPYNVSENNCVIELIQPKGKNKHAIFTVREKQSLTYAYERNTEDPRIEHNLNIKFDQYGNVLENAFLAYQRKNADNTLPQEIKDIQAKTIITYTLNTYTNKIDDTDEYHLPVPSEIQAYELKGLPKTGTYYTPKDFDDILNTSTTVDYKDIDKDPAVGVIQKREIEHSRYFYYKNDLTGALPLHQLQSKALLFENYLLAFTKEQLIDTFGSKVNSALMQKGKYVHSEGDENWWIPSGTKQYIQSTENITHAQNRFYKPISYTDPYGNKTKIKYWQDCHFLIQETEDAVNNKIKILDFNLRTLEPKKIQDQNDNITESISDELGIIKATAVLGKGNEADNLSAHKEYTLQPEKTLHQNFLNAPNSALLESNAKAILKNASAVFVYNLDCYKNSGGKEPAFAASIRREEYHKKNQNSPVQIEFQYSNGFGQVLMKKTQSEPGLANNVKINPDNSFTIAKKDTRVPGAEELRWLVTENQLLNNNGEPVKQYEPYYSLKHKSENPKELAIHAVAPVTSYDALERPVKTELPDDTFTKTEYTSWKQVNYDQNDTVLDSDWYTKRYNREIDAELTAEHKNPENEKKAAEKAALHYNTPSSVHIDCMGRGILQTEHNKDSANTDIFHNTITSIDVEGNIISVKDARGNLVMEYKNDMLGETAYQKSMDSGQRWMLNDIMGNPLAVWDERNNDIQYTYDQLHRLVEKRIMGGDGTTPLNHIFEKTIYGEGLPNDKNLNQRGMPVKIYDTAGLLEIKQYDFRGLPLVSKRKLAKNYKNAVNWDVPNPDSLLEGDYTFTSEYDALERITEQITPDGSKIIPAYNKSGLFFKERVEQQKNGTTETIECIKNIEYNEKGLKEKIRYGNDITSTYYYDKNNYQLTRLNTKKQNNDPLQDLYYTFDPVGNINFVEDKNIPAAFFNNQKIQGTSEYTYDALYQLIECKGREHAAQTAFGNPDNWNDIPFLKQYQGGDSLAWRNYTLQYIYDKVGNMLQEKHIAANNNWTRNNTYSNTNNRLLSSAVGSDTYNYTHHAKHGFITSMPHLQKIEWDFNDQILSVSKQHTTGATPETTYYQYDNQGERIRKVTETQASGSTTPVKKEERIYFPSYEIYIKHNGSNAGLERYSLNLLDEGNRFCIIEKRNHINDGTDEQTIRYQHGDYLNSVSLETNHSGDVISYEEYYPYGNTSYQAVNKNIKAAAKRYRYTQKERDAESGLMYHGARYYAPWLGRWLSPDPIGIDDGVNVYAYVGNNPVMKHDPTGLCDCDPDTACCPPDEPPVCSEDNELLKAEKKARAIDDQEIPVITEYEYYDETYVENEIVYEKETYTVTKSSGAKASAFMGGTLVVAGGTSQLDSPLPGPADAVAVGELVVGGVIALGIWAFASSQTITKTRVVPRVIPKTKTRRKKRKKKLVYVTYTMTNPTTGQVYSGRSRGYGTPQQVVAARGLVHHMTARGFGPPVLDKFAYATKSIASRHSDTAYRSIRGREQQLIDHYGGSKSDGGTSGNAIRGVSKINPLGKTYHKSANLRFGNLHAYTGF